MIYSEDDVEKLARGVAQVCADMVLASVQSPAISEPTVLHAQLVAEALRMVAGSELIELAAVAEIH